MNPAPRWLSIIGIGEDGLHGLSPAARAMITQASLVVGGRRHLDLVADALTGERLAWPSPPQAAFADIQARRPAPVCVVATGDPFFYGIGSLLSRVVPAEEIVCLPAVSAFSLAASRLGWALQDCALISLHGRELPRIMRYLQPRRRVMALSWDAATPHRLADLLVRHGFGGTRITVCEAMGGPRERLRTTHAAGFELDAIDPLNLLAIEVAAAPDARIIPLTPGLPNAWFEHDGQLTKCQVRAVTLAALAPRPGALLWDIGAGSGSVGIEWMLADPSNRAIAIERDPIRADRIARNAAALGVPELSVHRGTAPEALAGLPAPDAVFVGGGATRPGVIAAAWSAMASGGRLVANGVSLEAHAALTGYFGSYGGDLCTIQISQADSLGRFHVLRPAMAVMQWSVTRR